MIPDYDDGGMLSLRAGLVVTKPLVFEQSSDKASTGSPMHSSTSALALEHNLGAGTMVLALLEDSISRE